MEQNKKKFMPLHERIQSSQGAASIALAKMEENNNILNDLYRGVFETEEGVKLLEYLVDKYIGKVPSAVSTTNEIMFLHGQSYIIHEILSHLRKEK